MKMKCLLITVVTGMMLLSGCGIRDLMEKKSGIQEDENYQKYVAYEEANRIDENGYVIEKILEEIPDGAAHITFCKNSNITTSYYLDSDMEIANQIDGDECYLLPGQKIYAKEEENRSVKEGYDVRGYKIFVYDDNGRKYEYATISATNSKEAIFTIPDSDKDIEFSIEPFGEYPEIDINCSSYCLEGDEIINVESVWRIDEEETVRVKTGTEHAVSCDYDEGKYFVVSTFPEKSRDNGNAVFFEKTTMEDTLEYKIELHEYLTIPLRSTIERIVYHSDGSKETVKENDDLNIEKLRYGQSVVIETNKTWDSLLADDRINFSCEKVGEGTNTRFRYVGYVIEPGESFEFDPKEFADIDEEHGTLEFFYNGRKLELPYRIVKGRRLELVGKPKTDDYYLADSDRSIVIGDENETKEKIESIRFTPVTMQTVILPQPEEGGKVNYYIDHELIVGDKVEVKNSSVIEIEYIPWEGWYSESTVNEYVVKNVGSQKAIDDDVLRHLFTEDPEHKPVLTVVLKKSCGEQMQCGVTASGEKKADASTYDDKWYRNDYKIVNGEKIGTSTGIELDFSTRAIQSGTAVKIEVETKDKAGNKEKRSPIYFTQLPCKQTIDIYKEGPAKSTNWYESIEITVSVVDIMTVDLSEFSIENGRIEYINVTTNTVVREHSIIEASDQITCTFKPSAGYYISGKGTSNDEFSFTEKYEKLADKLKENIQSHPVMKYYHITLDYSNSYAKYIYKIDGKVVSGRVKVKEGQDIELSFEIIDDKYELEKPSGYLLWKNNKKTTATITFTNNLDEKTLGNEDFGIKVKRVE